MPDTNIFDHIIETPGLVICDPSRLVTVSTSLLLIQDDELVGTQDTERRRAVQQVRQELQWVNLQLSVDA
jgi:hypothetical protein